MEKNTEMKRNILIAGKVCEVLKAKMLIKQTGLSRAQDPDSKDIRQYVKELGNLKEELDAVEKDDPKYAELSSSFQDYIAKYADKVTMSKHEIAELVAYVRSFLMRFNIPTDQKTYDNNGFVRVCLRNLDEFIKYCHECIDSELGMFLDFFCSSSAAGFYANDNNLYTINGKGYDFFTIQDHGKLIYSIDEEGNINTNQALDFENSMLIDDISVGYIEKEGKKILTLLLRQGGYNKTIFTSSNSKKEAKTSGNALCSLACALNITGMTSLCEPIYDKLMLEYVVTSLNESPRDIMKKIETNNISNLASREKEEIPSSELSLTYEKRTDSSGNTPSFSYYKPKSYVIKVDRQPGSLRGNFNEILDLLGLSYLKEDSYDVKKIEYIVTCMKKNQTLPIITIDDETPQQKLVK